MGQKASKASQDRGHPSLEDVWREIAEDRKRELASLVKTADIARITGKDTSIVLWKAKQIGVSVKYGSRRVAYVTLEDAVRVMRELA